MNNFEFLREIVINDEDILSAQEILGSKLIFDSRRKEIIKNMKSVDIQAFPGSGKTTILVVKLVILAKKWILNNSGLCVLSHTNVAREEIEQKIGNNNVGKKILSYPHFIGTFHSFFDTYIAIPWLKSKGYTISIINSEYVQSLRWKRLPCNTKNYLEKHMKNESICTYNRNLGEINWNKNDKAKLQILDVIQKTQKEGYFTFDEMLLYAKQALEEHSTISSSIQQRFPILFIDEAQDTDSLQWDLIQKAFNEDGTSSIRQVFGDSNQAIYNSFFVDEELKYFPRMNALVMNESKRFDSRIANLANTITLSAEQMIGTDNEFTEKKINHTILLFNKREAKRVINEYGKLILNNFSDDDIRKYHKEGCHAVGMIHIKKKRNTRETVS